MPSRNFEVISSAVRDRLQIHATYKNRHRLFCPHAVGYKDGREKALFYQFGGGSNTGLSAPFGPPYGSPENWRCVFVSELTGVEAVPGEWHTALNHSKRQTCIDRVIERVDR